MKEGSDRFLKHNTAPENQIDTHLDLVSQYIKRRQLIRVTDAVYDANGCNDGKCKAFFFIDN